MDCVVCAAKRRSWTGEQTTANPLIYSKSKEKLTRKKAALLKSKRLVVRVLVGVQRRV
jgi:hypothetical protein